MKASLVVFALLFATTAFAQEISQDTGIIGNGRMLGAKTADSQTTVGVLGIDADGNTQHNAMSGEVHEFSIGNTTVATLDSNGAVPSTLPAVITPMTSITPVAGAALAARVSIMATAAPTFAIVMLPAATSNPNKSFGVYNKSASPLLFHLNGVASTDSINAAAAGTPYSCATGKFCDCRVIGAGTYMCVSQ